MVWPMHRWSGCNGLMQPYIAKHITFSIVRHLSSQNVPFRATWPPARENKSDTTSKPDNEEEAKETTTHPGTVQLPAVQSGTQQLANDEGMHVQRMLFEGVAGKCWTVNAEDSVYSSVVRAQEQAARQAASMAHTKQASTDASTTEQETDEPQDELHRLDIRVARIMAVHRHAEADTLYVEQVDVGDPEETAQGGRVIVSGLVPYITIPELEGRLVVMIKNMKPIKLRGVISRGMLLCAERDGKVELLDPPAESNPGDRVFANGYDKGRPDPVLNPKKKVWDRVAQFLRTDEYGIATYRGEALRTQHGRIRARTIQNGIIR
jgi:methionine--tRNA ligase beta chain